MKQFTISFDDACDVQARPESRVSREILEQMRAVINDGGRVVIQNVFANTPAETGRVIASVDGLNHWLNGSV